MVMATFERQIDALDGAVDQSHDSEYNAGWNGALELATPIAADADQVISELVEAIEDMLNGNRTLKRWAEDAETLVRRVKGRCM